MGEEIFGLVNVDIGQFVVNVLSVMPANIVMCSVTHSKPFCKIAHSGATLSTFISE